MSDHNPHNDHGSHNSNHGQVESSALSPKPILLFMAVLFVATAFVFLVVKGLEWSFRKLDQQTQGQPATDVQAGRRLPPEPLLQGAPGESDKPTELPLKAMETLRKQTEEQITSYGWVDKPGGVARIPIERAKEIIAEKGLPALSSPEVIEGVRNAATARKEVLSADSNAGRMIKVPAQSQQPAPQPAPQLAQQPQENQQQVSPQQH
ncbi:MAG TPA: hypothetical protein VIM99_02535 [Blastocatellia bacterium]